MAKTKEELNALKQEFESLSSKLAELSEEELSQVTGGNPIWAYSVGVLMSPKDCAASTMIKSAHSILQELPEE